MPEYGLTEKGITIKRLSDIIDEIHDDLTDKWGINTRQNPQSYLNVLITNFSDRIAELWEVGQEIYYSAFPMTAEGVYLDNAAQYAGLYRGQGRQSQYYVKCVGEAGNTIPSGLMISTDTKMNPVTYLTILKSYDISTDRVNYAEIKFASDSYFDEADSDKNLTITINGRSDTEGEAYSGSESYTVNGKDTYQTIEVSWDDDYTMENGIPSVFESEADMRTYYTGSTTENTGYDDDSSLSILTESFEKGGVTYKRITSTVTNVPDAQYIFESFVDQINSEGTGSDYFDATYETRINGGEVIHYLILTAKTSTETDNHKISLPKYLTTERIGTICVFLTEGYGDIYLPNGSVTSIHGNESGLESVENVGTYVPGNITETDTEFRQSYIDRIFTHSSRMCQSIRSAILNNVDNVISCRVYENIGNDEDEYGRPAHSVEAVVQGGSSEEIAVQIFKTKAAGINTYGSVLTYVTDGEQELPIYFNRPTKVLVYFSVNVSGLDDNSAEIDTDTTDYDTTEDGWRGVIRQIIVKKVNALDAGEKIVPQELILPEIYSNLSGIDYIEINMWTSEDIYPRYALDDDGNETTEVVDTDITTHKNMYFDYNEIAVTSEENITVYSEDDITEEEETSEDDS